MNTERLNSEAEWKFETVAPGTLPALAAAAADLPGEPDEPRRQPAARPGLRSAAEIELMRLLVQRLIEGIKQL
jgi:hypothetical protein